MKYRNLYLIISVLVFQWLFIPSAHCQDMRLKRIALQYQEHKATSNTEKEDLNIQIANAYLAENIPEKAESTLEKVTKDSVNKFSYYFTYAKVYFAQDKFEECLSSINVIDLQNSSSNEKRELIFLKIICLNHLLEFEASKSLLCQHLLSVSSDTSGISNAYEKALNMKLYDTRKAARKSRIPGMGLFYVDEPNRAAVSILLNTLFLGYTAYSIYSGHYFTAALTGVSQFMRFYSGGRRAAVNYSFKKNNELKLKTLISIDEYCQKKYFGD